jgi:hypothetical protein
VASKICDVMVGNSDDRHDPINYSVRIPTGGKTKPSENRVEAA